MCGHACTLPQKHNPTFSQLGNREFCARLWSHILLRQSEKTNNRRNSTRAPAPARAPPPVPGLLLPELEREVPGHRPAQHEKIGHEIVYGCVHARMQKMMMMPFICSCRNNK